MKIISSKNKLIKIVKKNRNLGFVPTMGGIHDGHISLIRKSISQSDKTIVSIYINKPQFNKKADFIKYPKNTKKDINKLKKLKINFLYLPRTKDLYPKGRNKNIKINSFSKKLCGKYRPGHFEAVVDVIDRFIKIINPKKIFMGQKDMQQFMIVDDYVKKNYPNIKMISCKTIREKNGIALSSRNFLLSQKQKLIASKIIKNLLLKKKVLIKNKFNSRKLKKIIFKFGVKKIDYAEIIDINNKIKPYKKKKKKRIFIAYYLGSTRLIDNI